MLAENFETLVTCDKNLEYQQRLDLPVSLIVLVVPNTRVSTVMPLASAILEALDNVQPGEIVHISRARLATQARSKATAVGLSCRVPRLVDKSKHHRLKRSTATRIYVRPYRRCIPERSASGHVDSGKQRAIRNTLQ